MKTIRRDVALVVLAAVIAGMGAPELRAQQEPLRAALANRIDEAKRGTGVMVGLLTPDGRSFTTYGRVSAAGSEPTAETMFEIGSITKVFTALLLADMVERGEVALDDPVRKYLPHSGTMPSRGSRQISLADLAGAIRSTAADMLVFAEAAMGGATPLKTAFARMTSVRRPHPNRSMQQALGWSILRLMGTEILAHDGGTHGFRTQLMVDSTNKRAAIVWINAGGPQGVNDLATYAVEPRSQLAMLPAVRAIIALDEATLEGYVGSYRLSPTMVITVTREAARLFGQATGQSRFELFAETRDKFFVKVVNAQISFTRGPRGEVNGLVLHQNGRNQPASKDR